MKFLITGATGLVGQRLIQTLFESGYNQVHVLSRNKKSAQEKIPFPVVCYEWNPSTGEIDLDCFNQVDVVIHLAGESVAERWNKKKKEDILNSRVQGTTLLAESIKNLTVYPKKIISASAIGFYGDRANEPLSSDSTPGQGFLAEVCRKWEGPILDLNLGKLQTHILRIGIVLARNGGALKQMLPPFQAGVAGNLGNGKQYMSWIHIDDLVGQMIFLAEQNVEEKIFNGVGLEPLTNADFTKTLGKVLFRPTLFPVPTLALKILFGEMSQILLNSQRVLPKNFFKHGFHYKFTKLEDALEDLLKHKKKGENLLTTYQWIHKDKKEVFQFFSDEMNLEKITPKYLNFKVLGKSTDKIQSGTLIDYKLKLHGIPIKWKTRINQFEPDSYFIDEQLKGPYSKWYHTHKFFSFENGTLMKDEIIYKIPLGLLGQLLLGYFVKKDVIDIFNFRKQTIKRLFST